MAYSTPAMVRKAVVPTGDGGVPTTPTGTAADLSDAQLSDAIAEADATIDSYIGGFYAVPVAVIPGIDGGDPQVPSPVSYWSRTLALYNATSMLRGELDMDDANPILRRYNAVLGALKMVAAGTMKLQLPNNVGPNADTGAGAPYNPYVGDLFTPDDFGLGYGGAVGYGPFRTEGF